MIVSLPVLVAAGANTYAPLTLPPDIVGTPLLTPEKPANNYGTLGEDAQVALRILDQIIVRMRQIAGIRWADMGDIIPTKGPQVPGILVRQISDREVGQVLCHTSECQLVVEIAGFIRASHKPRAAQTWRQELSALQAEIIKAIRIDTRWNELARSTTLTSKRIYEPTEGLCVCDVSIVVNYATVLADPSQPS